jgi:hypothetical protein
MAWVIFRKPHRGFLPCREGVSSLRGVRTRSFVPDRFRRNTSAGFREDPFSEGSSALLDLVAKELPKDRHEPLGLLDLRCMPAVRYEFEGSSL